MSWGDEGWSGGLRQDSTRSARCGGDDSLEHGDVSKYEELVWCFC